MNSNQNENLPNSIVRIKEAAFKTNRSVEAMNCVICVWFHQCYIFSAQGVPLAYLLHPPENPPNYLS